MPEVRYKIGSRYPVLSRFMQCRAPVSVIRGPLGSGKTIGTVQRILDQMTEAPANAEGERKSRWLAVRNTYLDLTETTIKDFLAVFEPLGTMRYGGLEPPNFHARFRIQDGTMVDAEVIFLALDRDDSIRKLKGYQVTGIWFNELSEIAKSIVDMADLRLGRFSELQGGVRGGWYGWLGDTNSFDESHWLHALEERPPEGWEFFIQPGGVVETGELDANGEKIWAVNPAAENLENLPEGYYQRGMRGKDEMWIRVMLANKKGYVRKGKPVHPRFREDVHTIDRLIEPLPQYPIDLGFDFGRTPACSIGQEWKHIGRYVGLRSLTSNDMSAALFGPEVKRLLDKDFRGFGIRGWGDPAGDAESQATEDTPIRVIRACGIPIVAAPSNMPVLRRAALDNPLTRMCVDGRPAYLLSKPGCPELVRALSGGFHYRELQVSGPQKRYGDKPEKNDDSHVAEAEEYRLLGCGEGRAALIPAAHLHPHRDERPQFAESSW